MELTFLFFCIILSDIVVFHVCFFWTPVNTKQENLILGAFTACNLGILEESCRAIFCYQEKTTIVWGFLILGIITSVLSIMISAYLFSRKWSKSILACMFGITAFFGIILHTLLLDLILQS